MANGSSNYIEQYRSTNRHNMEATPAAGSAGEDNHASTASTPATISTAAEEARQWSF